MFFNIQRYSLHDGPGIRTTLFFKGCPLRCRWCCNPESWAVVRSKGDISMETALGAMARDAVFYRSSGGGITFSGGEPFMHPGALIPMVSAAADAGIATAAETSGYFDFDAVLPALTLLDDIFMDIKQMDDLCHKALTGVSNRKILSNIKKVDKLGKSMTIRMPMIQGLNDQEAHIRQAVLFCRELAHLSKVELMPYHALGQGKYEELGLPYDHTLAPPSGKILNRILEQFRQAGLTATYTAPLTNGPD